MNETPKFLERTNGRYDAKDIIDFLVILTKWRKFIVLNFLAVAFMAAMISLFLPKWYASTSSIIPPKENSGFLGEISGFAATLQNISKTLGKSNTAPDELYYYLAILKSRTVMEKVVQAYNLREVYEIDESAPIEDVIAALGRNVDLTVHEEGNLTITVYDKKAQRAADMANFFVKTLNDLGIQLGVQEAKTNREFIELRYRQAQSELRASEDTLKKFQQKHNLYALPEQTKAAVGAAAALKSKILIKEIEMGVMERIFEKNAAEIKRVRLELNEMNKKLAEMQYGPEQWHENKTQSLFIPFNEIPELGMEYLRLYRDFEIRNKLLGFLLPIYEQAKIEEQKNIPIVVVLDNAVPAQKKARPRRSLIVLFSACLSLFASITVVLWYEAFLRLKTDPERYQKIQRGVILPFQNSLSAFFKTKPKQ